MLGRWLRSRRVEKEEHNRQIFYYKCGDTERWADPMIICLALQVDPKYTAEHLRKAKAADPISMEIVANAAEKAFDVERLNTKTGKGQTIAELVGLVDAFDLWCFNLQKKTAHLQT